MVLFQNSYNKVVSSSSSSSSTTSGNMVNNDTVQLNTTIHNNQLELMQMLHLLHGMQVKMVKDMVDFTSRFDSLEEQLCQIRNEKEELRELLLQKNDKRMPKEYKKQYRSSTFDDNQSGCENLLSKGFKNVSSTSSNGNKNQKQRKKPSDKSESRNNSPVPSLMAMGRDENSKPKTDASNCDYSNEIKDSAPSLPVSRSFTMNETSTTQKKLLESNGFEKSLMKLLHHGQQQIATLPLIPNHKFDSHDNDVTTITTTNTNSNANNKVLHPLMDNTSLITKTKQLPQYVCIPQLENKEEIKNDGNNSKSFNTVSKSNSSERLSHLMQKQPSFGRINTQSKSFDQFYLLSILPETILSDSMSIHDLFKGSWSHLHPYTFRSTDLLDKFPDNNEDIPSNEEESCKTTNSSLLSFEEVSSVCFPSGIKVRVLPKCALENAKKLGYVNKDKYQLHTFTDVKGECKFGISITTQEVITEPNKQIIELLHKKRLASMKIKNALRKYVSTWKEQRKNILNNVATIRKNHSMNNMFEKFQVNEVCRRLSFTSKTAFNVSSFDDGFCFEEESLSNVNSYHNKYFNSCSLTKASESYETMIANEALGDVYIVEKCYILIGTCLDTQSLLLNSLQHMIDYERYDMSSPDFNDQESYSRYKILKSIHNKACLSRKDKKKAAFDLKLDNNNFPTISLPLPLPQLTSEWGVATLFLKMKKPYHLLLLLKLLLIERSVLVVGVNNHEEVTFCTRALLELLKPFQWSNVYISLIPDGAIDFVSSPVPFVAGFVADSSLDLDRTLNDVRIQHAIMNGMSVLNLSKGEVIITNENISVEVISKPQILINDKLASLQKKFKLTLTDSTLSCCKNYIKQGASKQEMILINSMKQIISNHFNYIANCISESIPNSRDCHWKMYGQINKTTKAFDYTPSSLLSKLKSDLMFHEILVHTQMFSGYVETELKYASASLFIVDWISYRWNRKRKCDSNNRRTAYYWKKIQRQQNSMSPSTLSSLRKCGRGSYPNQYPLLSDGLKF